MTSVPVVVPLYAALLTVVFIVLSLRVGSLRGKTNIWIGAAGNSVLERRMRVQANFAEYVPLALLLLTFLEMQQYSRILLHVLCLVLLFGRLVHAYGVSQDDEDVRYRMIGIAATVLLILVVAILLLITGLRAVMI